MTDQTSQKTPWNRRGFGWIPDLPDVRDFTPVDIITGYQQTEFATIPDHDKEQEFLGNIVAHLAKVTEILQSGKERLSPAIIKQLQTQAGELNQYLFSDFSFPNAKIYRVLRQGVNNRDVLKLKYALHLLTEREVLPTFDLRRASPDFREDQTYWEWLGKPEFDKETEQAVKQFQQAVNESIEDDRGLDVPGAVNQMDLTSQITVDGIVGLETYLTLENYFVPITNSKNSEERKLSLDESYAIASVSGIPRRNDKQKPCNQQITKPKLVSIPSLIPAEAYEPMLDAFRLLWLCAKRSQTTTNKITRSLRIKERIRVESGKIIRKVRMMTKEELKLYLRYHQTCLESELILSLSAEGENVFLNEFVEAFNSEFSVIEPIIAIAMMGIYPLARFTDLNEAMRAAFLEFHLLFLPHSNEVSELEDLQRLGFAAIQKVEKNLAWESQHGTLADLEKRLTSRDAQNCDPQDENKLKSLKSFYSMMGTIIEMYKKLVPNNLSENANLFDKEVLFQIINPGCEEARELSSSSISLGFSASQLQIPVSSNLYHLKSFAETQNENYYLYLPGVVDLSYWCSPVEDQGKLNSCAALAGIALMEYYAQRNLGDYINLSSLFLYKATRNLMEREGDVGASVRQTMRAIVLFGVPPEKYWPYREELVDVEPPPFCYSYAQNFQGLKYFRLDQADLDRETLLLKIKATLAAGFPCMFGFTVYSSAFNLNNLESGHFPIPSRLKDKVVGGHVVVAVGYSDFKRITPADNSKDSKGAFLIRNCWGKEWGKEGYGWLPYEYVVQGITADWWSLVKAEWLQEGYFGLGVRDPGNTVWPYGR